MKKKMIIGFYEEGGSVTANNILLLYKRYIYNCKLSNKIVNLLGFKSFLTNIIEVEKQIAAKKNKIDSHFMKWQNIEELL